VPVGHAAPFCAAPLIAGSEGQRGVQRSRHPGLCSFEAMEQGHRHIYEPVAMTYPHEHLPRYTSDHATPQSSSPAYVASANPLVAVTDACSMSPALRAWIECLVDARLDHAFRQFREGDLAQAHRDGVATSQSSSIFAAQQAAQAEAAARQRLETEVRSLADAQVRMLSVVEGVSGDQDHQHASSGLAFGRVMSTMDELQRMFEQEGDGAANILQQHDASLKDFSRVQAASQEELSRLSKSVNHLDSRLSAFCKDLPARVSEEVVAVTAASTAAGRETLGALAREGQDELRDELRRAEQTIRDEVVCQHRKLSTELRAEHRGTLKSEHTAVAALDEQLWMVERRMSQRIDELHKAMVGPIGARQTSPRSVSANRLELPLPRNDASMSSTTMRPGVFAPTSSQPMSDAAQLELLRSARSRMFAANGDRHG